MSAVNAPQPPPAEPSPGDSALQDASGGLPRVLVVDDDPGVNAANVGLLRSRYQVDACLDAAQAWDAIVRAPPDLVITDLLMPGESGIALTRRIKEHPRTREVGVIVLTAFGGEDALSEALGAGADDYIAKPYGPREMLARVDTQLRLRRQARELSEAGRVALLAALSAGLAHEVRNPIGAMGAAVPLLRPLVEQIADPQARARAERLVRVLSDGTGRIEGLVTDLVRVAAEERMVLHAWTVSEVLPSTLHLLESRHPGVRVETAVDDAPAVLGQPGRLGQVVMNLLDNAFWAAGRGGRVRIEASALGEGLCIAVDDSGPGVDPALVGRLFEPFVTSRPPGQGTGLGLYLVRQVVVRHTGWVRVERGPLGGARFIVWLPLMPRSDDEGTGTDPTEAASTPYSPPIVRSDEEPHRVRA